VVAGTFSFETLRCLTPRGHARDGGEPGLPPTSSDTDADTATLCSFYGRLFQTVYLGAIARPHTAWFWRRERSARPNPAGCGDRRAGGTG
jgi:hypothetical protein